MPKNASKPKSEYAIQTVTNALRMLEVFHSETEMGVSDLARRLGLHKNNAFRLLATLELAGYIQQTPETDLYHLGPRCLELAHAFARSHTLMSQARPILEELARDFGETAHLGVLAHEARGDEVVHLDGVLPDQLVLTGSRVGERLPAHCTALGKTLLAGRLANRGLAPVESNDGLGEPVDARAKTALAHAGETEDVRGRSHAHARGHAHAGPSRPAATAPDFSRWELRRYTDSTFDDGAKLVEELRGIQLRGYATDVEEYSPGLQCVAAPVRDASARVIASLSLSGPSLRMTEEVLHGAGAEAITRAAARLSRELGSPI